MAMEEDRKSPIDWKFGNSESDENGVLLDVILTFHDLDMDSNKESEIETCRFSFEEVDAKLDRYGIGNERYFYRANVAKKLSEEIAKVEEALEKRLANFAKDSLADAKIPPRTAKPATNVRVVRRLMREDQ